MLKHTWDLSSFMAGIAVALLAALIITSLAPKTSVVEKSGSEVSAKDDTETETQEPMKAYQTDIKNWTVTLSNGKKLNFYTPAGYYSLSDQYLENLANYYKSEAEIKSSSVVVVGDKDTPYASETLINADTISDVSNILSQLYGDEYDASQVTESEAYVYLKTGKLPDKLPDNYTIDEVERVDVDGVTYVVYDINYDNTYKDEDGKDTVVHTQQLSCYSVTEDDAVEIILYQSEFNKEQALAVLHQFLGVNKE